MKSIEDTELYIRPSAEAHTYLQYLKENGIFERMIDAYIFAAAIALKEDSSIVDITLFNRQDLTNIGVIDESVRLALETGIHIICQRNYLTPPTEDKEILELIHKYAEVGLQSLKSRWEGKVGNQIHADIQKLVS